MESIKKIFKTGIGPSSSHTMGPNKAAEIFKANNPEAFSVKVSLYGSLAATGKGHMTDKAILSATDPLETEIIWKTGEELPYHENGMLFEAFDKSGKKIKSWTVYSIGGGELYDPEDVSEKEDIYPDNNLSSIVEWAAANNEPLWKYVQLYEKDAEDHLKHIWETMCEVIRTGLKGEGKLPGILQLPRKAARYYLKAKDLKGYAEKTSLIFAYTLAVSEENAAGHRIVTAPTCGAAGVVPGMLFFLKQAYELEDNVIIHALATAGLIGALIRENASISGAEVGCQGEVGTACAMASAAAAQILGGSVNQVEYAAEMGLEHHLGLTCDPVYGLVQIPCIERNALAAVRALDASVYTMLSDGRHRVSFDTVVKVMKQTGHDLKKKYRETGAGGLTVLKENKFESSIDPAGL